MVPTEFRGQIDELAAEIGKAIGKARAAWVETYGGALDHFDAVATGAIAHEMVNVLVGSFARTHGHRPPIDHLIATLQTSPMVLVEEAAAMYGLRCSFAAVPLDDLPSPPPRGPVH